MNVDIIDKTIGDVRKILGDSLVTTVLTGDDGLGITGYNSNDESSGFVAMLTNHVKSTLASSGFAPLDRLYMGRLANNLLGIIFLGGSYYWSFFIDLNKVNLGIVMNVIVPRVLQAFDKALEAPQGEVAP
jgi:hypothetical protein